MSHTPDNIRNMWEEAAKRNLDEGFGNWPQQPLGRGNPYGSQQKPGMGSGLDQRALTAGAREQLRRQKPLTPAAQTSDAGAIGPQGPQGAAGAGGAVGRTKKKD